MRRLIREQKGDDRYRVYREDHVAGYIGDTNLYLSNEGMLRHSNMGVSECPLHGRKGMVIRPSGRIECGACDRKRSELRRRARGVKPRVKAECDHPVTRHRSHGEGRIRCLDCRAAQEREAYHRNIEARRKKAREWHRKNAEKLNARKREKRRERKAQDGNR